DRELIRADCAARVEDVDERAALAGQQHGIAVAAALTVQRELRQDMVAQIGKREPRVDAEEVPAGNSLPTIAQDRGDSLDPLNIELITAAAATNGGPAA